MLVAGCGTTELNFSHIENEHAALPEELRAQFGRMGVLGMQDMGDIGAQNQSDDGALVDPAKVVATGGAVAALTAKSVYNAAAGPRQTADVGRA